MQSYRPILLASAMLLAGGGCKPPPTPTADDLRTPADLTSSPDLSSADLSSQDLATGPDLAVACGYRQAYVPEQMACACDAPQGHTVLCSATFCCSTGQTCLDGDRCSAPPGRARHAMAYDSKLGRTAIFGGEFYEDASTQVKPRDDLWQLDAVTFGPIAPAGAKPSARVAPALAFDGNQLVLFGGRTGPNTNMLTASGETWRLNGNAWTQVVGAGPPARSGPGMVFDSARSRVVLFGGEGATALLNDTWEWTGVAWLQKTIAGTPPTPRENPGMAYDAKRGNTVLFGGTVGVYNYSNETWVYNGAVSTWTKLTTATTPKARSLTGMAYDANRERVVMFSGEVPGVAGEPDLWEWDGVKWTQIPLVAGPLARVAPAMVYDPVRKVTLVYGGTTGTAGASTWANDVWSWDGAVWKQLY